MSHYLWIAIGSAAGGILRYWLGIEITKLYGNAFPWGTITINVTGSFLIGLASSFSDQQIVRFLVMVGLCGGFTTFSSFSLETLTLLREGMWQKAVLYAVASVALCVMSTFAGSVITRKSF